MKDSIINSLWDIICLKKAVYIRLQANGVVLQLNNCKINYCGWGEDFIVTHKDCNLKFTSKNIAEIEENIVTLVI